MTSSPVRGLRPIPVLCGRILNTPKPRSSMRSPFSMARFMVSKTVSTAISDFVLLSPVRFTTALTMSYLIMVVRRGPKAAEYLCYGSRFFLVKAVRQTVTTSATDRTARSSARACLGAVCGQMLIIVFPLTQPPLEIAQRPINRALGPSGGGFGKPWDERLWQRLLSLAIREVSFNSDLTRACKRLRACPYRIFRPL